MKFIRYKCSNCGETIVSSTSSLRVKEGDVHYCVTQGSGTWLIEYSNPKDSRQLFLRALDAVSKAVELQILDDDIKDRNAVGAIQLYRQKARENNQKVSLDCVLSELSVVGVLVALPVTYCLLDDNEIEAVLRYRYQKKYDCLDKGIAKEDLEILSDKDLYLQEFEASLRGKYELKSI